MRGQLNKVSFHLTLIKLFWEVHTKKAQQFCSDPTLNDSLFLQNSTLNAHCFHSQVSTYPSLSHSSAMPILKGFLWALRFPPTHQKWDSFPYSGTTMYGKDVSVTAN